MAELAFSRAQMTVREKLWQIHWLFVVLLLATAAVGVAMQYSAADGRMEPVAARDIVPGDRLLLAVGDRVPVDAIRAHQEMVSAIAARRVDDAEEAGRRDAMVLVEEFRETLSRLPAAQVSLKARQGGRGTTRG